jgi:predicted hydrocarbon binding protein
MSGPDAHVLELAYRSDRGRCDLAEGLILGAAEHYREAIELSQPACVHRGDDRCVLRVVSL